MVICFLYIVGNHILEREHSLYIEVSGAGNEVLLVGILPCELIPQQMATVVQVLAADEIVFDGVSAGRLHLANFAPVLGGH